jgi:hypothetical protein
VTDTREANRVTPRGSDPVELPFVLARPSTPIEVSPTALARNRERELEYFGSLGVTQSFDPTLSGYPSQCGTYTSTPNDNRTEWANDDTGP